MRSCQESILVHTNFGYIYEENKDVISDPDLVEPNTKVRIPNAAKYGIDANNRTSINNALNKSQEIARQRKK